ncbi:MAG: tRNA lysidine(34) synthetase TilS [Deltaproteobacteria bacterium]|nr:tRNA lysidine(34) synthetase TilS [Deltaproteobacteria bacterium]
MRGLPAKVSAALKRFFPEKTLCHLGVAVSGGPDSVALCGALVALAQRGGLRLTVLHVNHALRPEADREQQLVEELCRTWQLPCQILQLVPPHKRTGIEAWARAERYRFFAQMKEQCALDAVAVAHTRDDQAETVLLRLLRGTSRRGLAGMPSQREGWIIRPLLGCSRHEVMAYLTAGKLPYAMDASNSDVRYTRNRIRHLLLPLLEREFSPQIRRNLVQLAESLRPEEDWLEAQAQAACARVADGPSRLSVARLHEEPQALLLRILRVWLERSRQSGDLGFQHLTSVCALAEGRVRGEVELPGGWVVRREGKSLVFLAKLRKVPTLAYAYPLVPGNSLTIPETGWEVACSLPILWNADVKEAVLRDPWRALVDVNALSGPLAVRSMRPGDRMQPFGMQGHRKVHDIFVDKKVAARQRPGWPLVVCGETILWIPGCGRGELAKVTSETRHVCQLAANPLPEK